MAGHTRNFGVAAANSDIAPHFTSAENEANRKNMQLQPTSARPFDRAQPTASAGREHFFLTQSSMSYPTSYAAPSQTKQDQTACQDKLFSSLQATQRKMWFQAQQAAQTARHPAPPLHVNRLGIQTAAQGSTKKMKKSNLARSPLDYSSFFQSQKQRQEMLLNNAHLLHEAVGANPVKTQSLASSTFHS